jgi:pyruvate dehydrogenase E1 component alpha subunit
VAAGVCVNLTDADQVSSTHRGHGHLIAKGGDFRKAFAELFGKTTGYCRGKGGSMHISDLDLGMLGANGIVGGGVPIAVGAAFADKYTGSDRVSVSFFGDGATNIGAFHEAINMAAALQLPAVFVCENNGYGEFTPRERTQAVTDIADRAIGYGMPGVVIDGMDAVAVWEAAHEAVAHARAGNGPSFLEAKTYRYYDHQGIKGLGVSYRDDAEVLEWKQRDAIEKLEAQLQEAGVLDDAGIRTVHDRIQAEIDEAIAFAEESPPPGAADLLTDIYSERV